MTDFVYFGAFLLFAIATRIGQLKSAGRALVMDELRPTKSIIFFYFLVQ